MYDRRSVSVIKIQAAVQANADKSCPSTFSAKQFSRKIQMLARWKIKVKKWVIFFFFGRTPGVPQVEHTTSLNVMMVYL